ncbi:hypothetical protein F5B20DRAFT_572029 [Whalleya microplaca]|nr:hypothetical protein F5B20DRAFT_572029 [Whalleya microplaca]
MESLEKSMTIDNASLQALSRQADTATESQKPAPIFGPHPSTEAIQESFTDSGYSSQSTTPNEKPLAKTKPNPFHAARIPSLLFKKKKVSFIDKEIDDPTRERFRTIQFHFEELLLRQMRAQQKPAMMVVLCQSTHENLIQVFVKQKIVTDICRPDVLGVPSFEVVVLGNAPRLHVAGLDIEVITDPERIYARAHRNTLCGVPISFQDHGGQQQNATFGGIIKIVAANGEMKLFGMTAGHVLHQWVHRETMQQDNMTFLEDHQPSALSREGILAHGNDTQSVDTYELDMDGIEVGVEQFADNNSHEAILNVQDPSWEFKDITVLGHIVDTTKGDRRCSTRKCYDWALFQPTVYEMNQIPINGMEGKAQLSVARKRPGATGTRPVFVLSGSTGCKMGCLLSDPGRILLDDGAEFVDCFMVMVTDCSGIHDGDSGSWVVDAMSFEVYGQLVASDILGGGYVISMTDILDDMKFQLGAQSVGFPDFMDILHAKTVEDRTKTPRTLVELPATSSTDEMEAKEVFEEVFEEENRDIEPLPTVQYLDRSTLADNSHYIPQIPGAALRKLSELNFHDDTIHVYDSGYASIDFKKPINICLNLFYRIY